MMIEPEARMHEEEERRGWTLAQKMKACIAICGAAIICAMFVYAPNSAAKHGKAELLGQPAKLDGVATMMLVPKENANRESDQPIEPNAQKMKPWEGIRVHDVETMQLVGDLPVNDVKEEPLGLKAEAQKQDEVDEVDEVDEKYVTGSGDVITATTELNDGNVDVPASDALEPTESWSTSSLVLMFLGAVVSVCCLAFWRHQGIPRETIQSVQSIRPRHEAVSQAKAAQLEKIMSLHRRQWKAGRTSKALSQTPFLVNASNYARISADDLRTILRDGFGCKAAKSASKEFLISTLIPHYKRALEEFSKDRIGLILEAKGVRYNANLTKQRLVNAALEMGF
jgi:hypothetical protein